MYASEIAKKLAEDAEGVARMLLPGGRRSGSEYMLGDLEGNPGQSLRVHLTGEKAGVWSDFATGESGDLLDLWAKTRGICLGDAIKQAKSHLGCAEVEFTPRQEKQFKKPVVPKCDRAKEKSRAWEYLTGRGISPDAIRAYRIAETGSEVVFPYFHEENLVGIKYRGLGEKRFRVEAGCTPALFGWQAIPKNQRHVAITEGEIDAMSLYTYGYPSLSVPFGGGKGAKHAWIEQEYERLSRFDRIYLSFDNDREGQIALHEVVGRLGRERCFVLKIPGKDANEALMAKVDGGDIKRCFENARPLDPKELKCPKDFLDDVLEEFYPPEDKSQGLPLPFGELGNFAFRGGEFTIWSGINGHGKSMILSQVLLQAMSDGERVCVASLELKADRLLRRMIRQATANRLPSRDYIKQSINWLTDKLWIFDAVGTVKGEWILEVFKYAAKKYGISHFAIDSLMKCGFDVDDYVAEKKFVDAICDFKNEMNVHVHLVDHMRKPVGEDYNGGKMDIRGSGSKTDLADNVLTVWRNKKREEAMQMREMGNHQPIDESLLNSPDAILNCSKQREGEWEGKIGLYYSKETFQYLNSEHEHPKTYIGFEDRREVNLACQILGAREVPHHN